MQGGNDGTRPANAVPNVTEEAVAEVPREEGSDASSVSSWDSDICEYDALHYVEDLVDNTKGIGGGSAGADQGMQQAQFPWKKLQLPAVLPVVLNDIENLWF